MQPADTKKGDGHVTTDSRRILFANATQAVYVRLSINMRAAGGKLSILRHAATILFCLNLAAAGQEMKSEGSLTTNPVYQKNCAKCHGKTAEGRFMAGPSLVSGKATTMSADGLRTIITNGKHHMPKFGEKLSSSDVGLLVDQIRTQQKQK
ncbi:MAG: cytochrome c [Acidobacteriia bacterium]|nr:cytochrome c [Terriglobia bacterium]